MQLSYKIIIFSFIFVALIFGVYISYLSYNVKSAESGPTKEINFNHITKYQKLSHFHLPVISGVKDLSIDAKPIETYANLNPLFFDSQGYFPTGPFSSEVESAKYQDERARPFVLFTTFETEIESEKYIIFVYKWLNKDKTIVYLPLIANSQYASSPDTIERLTNSIDLFPSPILDIKDATFCEELIQLGPGYCKWYFENKSKANNIYESWMNKDIIPKEVESFPIPFTFIRVLR